MFSCDFIWFLYGFSNVPLVRMSCFFRLGPIGHIEPCCGPLGSQNCISGILNGGELIITSCGHGTWTPRHRLGFHHDSGAPNEIWMWKSLIITSYGFIWFCMILCDVHMLLYEFSVLVLQVWLSMVLRVGILGWGSWD